ncbi:MAG: hypothetical protein RQ866_03465 [Bacteroidales bacterium]|nr:hypothetical protein [Bacteroidales bacterium]
MKKNDFPIEPAIAYKDFILTLTDEGKPDKGILILSFTDGDGDIGLSEADTVPPFNPGSKYFYNFYISLFKKENGHYEKIIFPDTNFTFNSRIPEIELTGNSKSIKGTIEYTFDLQIMNAYLNIDTIRIETYIYDKALHQSNIVVTPDIVINNP